MTTENDVLDAVLSTREASQNLNLSPVTLKRMRKLPDWGGLPFVRLTPGRYGRVGYLLSDVLAYIAARRVGGVSTALDEGDITPESRSERFTPPGTAHESRVGAPAPPISAERVISQADNAPR